LLVWLLGGFLVYVLTGKSDAYYYSAGASVSLLVLIAYLLSQVFNKLFLAGLVILAAIIISNFSFIYFTNSFGPNRFMVIQPGLLITDEKRAVDYIYKEADGQPFSINALGVPLYIDTTWSYLFESYGQAKYGYLPVWGGRLAPGFAGNLKNETSRSNLPKLQFLILEPAEGIQPYQIKAFRTEENYFSKPIKGKDFGELYVEVRRKI